MELGRVPGSWDGLSGVDADQRAQRGVRGEGPVIAVAVYHRHFLRSSARWRDERGEHFPVLVDGAPQILPLALNRDEEFVQVPRVTQASLSPLERSA